MFQAPMFQANLFAGKTAFIAGGTSGINLEIAKNLARFGARVTVIGRDPVKAANAATEIMMEVPGSEALGMSADVRDPEQLAQAFAATTARFGQLNIVISGAAGNFLAPAISLSPKGFKTVIDIDLLGTYNVFQGCFEHLDKPGASLIAITAGQAVVPTPLQIHACCAKAGINMMVKCLAKEWGPAGIRVNGISPGPINDTIGMSKLAPAGEEPPLESADKSKIPLRRWGDKIEVANAAVYLCSAMASYITGTILDIEGGSQLGDASYDCLTPTR